MTLPLSIFIIVLVLTAACSATLGWIIGRRSTASQEDRLHSQVREFRDQSLFLQGQLESLQLENQHLHSRITSQGETAQALAPIAQQLSAVDSYVRALESKLSIIFRRSPLSYNTMPKFLPNYRALQNP